MQLYHKEYLTFLLISVIVLLSMIVTVMYVNKKG